MTSVDEPNDAGPAHSVSVPVSVPPPPPPPGPPAWPQPPFVARKSTNGFAIAALVCPLVACGIGSILGIVFGHVARRQIRKTGDGGSGLALAGLIIGYVSLALFGLGIGAVLLLATTYDGTAEAVSSARDGEQRIVRLAALRGVPPRDRDVVVHAAPPQCCGEAGSSDVTLGSTGVDVRSATLEDLDRVAWRLNFEWASGEDACLTVPRTGRVHSRDVVRGRC